MIINKYFIIFLLLTSDVVFSQTRLGQTSISQSERRMALVIGMSQYENIRSLKNPVNDADDMTATLEGLGFTVTKIKNQPHGQVIASINRFVNNLRVNDVVMFYFSGHGIGYLDDNYLLPVDTHIECLEQISAYSLSINRIIADINSKRVRNCFVILDACRSLGNLHDCNDNQNAKSVLNTKGFIIPQNQVRGNVIVYATQAGQTAEDNELNRNGLFTQELLKNIIIPDLNFGNILIKTANSVVLQSKKMNGYQEPTTYGLLGTEFVFLSSPGSTSKVEIQKKKEELEKEIALLKDKKENTVTAKKYIDLPFAEMVFVEGGSFDMGDTFGDGGTNEKPVHKVTVNSFYMGKYEVTQEQWEEIMDEIPSYSKLCPTCPVVNIQFEDIKKFIKWLNIRTGGNYRLPTEAEWEYAAREGGKKVRFGNGKDTIHPDEVNFDNRQTKDSKPMIGVYRAKPIKVGSFAPNKLGLFDMSGNAWEWCDSWLNEYTEKAEINPKASPYRERGTLNIARVIRGGDYGSNPLFCRASARLSMNPNKWSSGVGFRLVCSIE